MKKWQLTGPEQATSIPIADPLAAEPRSLPASFDPFSSSVSSVGVGISKEALDRACPH